jgi:hypothetical protein
VGILAKQVRRGRRRGRRRVVLPMVRRPVMRDGCHHRRRVQLLRIEGPVEYASPHYSRVDVRVGRLGLWSAAHRGRGQPPAPVDDVTSVAVVSRGRAQAAARGHRPRTSTVPRGATTSPRERMGDPGWPIPTARYGVQGPLGKTTPAAARRSGSTLSAAPRRCCACKRGRA